ncbi:hypothetical protein CANCADRAFT_108493 [Tortispora caseinolytica NRRL Y-17796]|uniref:Tryptophan synthase n=1 Tax=Tortispora caseinolytica NRRL Y-17796 TaxID=767744 RepID=A0A1E4TFS5_9ASCO|nr:hypothetical protein CANCADRAFT_108493 [Tortispora caseinolytica NRRL Y-17796]
MDHLKKAFQKARDEERPALVTFVTCGFPTVESTIPILFSLQNSGVDVIELGIPFSDAVADGPTVQNASNDAIKQGVTIHTVIDMVRKARDAGVHIPIVLMGYANPVLAYGEEKLVKDCAVAGVDGFILVDLPPEEAVRFRTYCTESGLSYVPLIAPSTTDDRMATLASITDSFVYVVSRMGVTGATTEVSAELPSLIDRVRKYFGSTPMAVGFGVSKPEHFASIGSQADGVVIGSKLITVIREAHEQKQDLIKAVADFIGSILSMRPKLHSKADPNNTSAQQSSVAAASIPLPKYEFGKFGGQFVPEILYDCLKELEDAYNSAMSDPAFWEEFRSYYDYMSRPSSLTYANRLTEFVGGAKIWLKREDLNHTGSHKINNAIGQVLLAKRLGKTRVIAETGAGQHGVATATAAAKFGLKCIIFMGAEDTRRQALNVFRIRLLGAEVVPVQSGTQTLRDAVNEAFKFWITDLPNTHYVIGSAIGPHPYPSIVARFQRVIGDETKEQMKQLIGGLPDAVVACVGGGSNSVGMFQAFEDDKDVKILGVEAGGSGTNTKQHSATLVAGEVGILHGVRTFLLQTDDGQVMDTHSISAGLDYPGVGPQLAYWKDTGRAQFVAATDAQCLQGFRYLSELEGIIPALESAHAVWGAMELAKSLPKEKNIVLCLSGRGDKDVQSVAELLPKFGPEIGWDLRFMANGS